MFNLNTVKRHERKRDDALSVFNKTLNKLDESQGAIDLDINKAEEDAAKAINRAEDLRNIRAGNLKIGNKIREFFAD